MKWLMGAATAAILLALHFPEWTKRVASAYVYDAFTVMQLLSPLTL